MTKYDSMYLAIEELKDKLDDTYYPTELSIDEINDRVVYIYALLMEYDNIKSEQEY